jgi:hypothetical protein
MNGDVPGVEACIRLANVFDESPAHVLYLAGYIDRDPGQTLPFELEKIVQKLEMLKSSGIYDQALRLVDQVLDTLLYKLDPPD